MANLIQCSGTRDRDSGGGSRDRDSGSGRQTPAHTPERDPEKLPSRAPAEESPPRGVGDGEDD